MKRSLIALLVVIVFAGYLGTLIARDPGYVLITYDGFAMQTSLWILLGLLLGITMAMYYLLRFLGVLKRSPVTYLGWRNERKAAKARELHSKGVALLAAGESDRARRYLEAAVESADQPGLVMLDLARAADGMNDGEARESYLRRAEETDVGLKRARAVVAAELALARKDGTAALLVLKDIRHNQRTIRLMVDALRIQSDWTEALQQLAVIKKFDAGLAQLLEEDMVLLGLSSLRGNDTNVGDLYRSASKKVKDDPVVVSSFVRALENQDEAEPVLRAAIKKHWLPEHIRLYGGLGEATLKTRRKTVEGWAKKQPDDAALQYCLGCVYEQAGEKQASEDAYRRSLALEEQPATRERLALVLAGEGQFEQSSELLLARRVAEDI